MVAVPEERKGLRSQGQRCWEQRSRPHSARRADPLEALRQPGHWEGCTAEGRPRQTLDSVPETGQVGGSSLAHLRLTSHCDWVLLSSLQPHRPGCFGSRGLPGQRESLPHACPGVWAPFSMSPSMCPHGLESCTPTLAGKGELNEKVAVPTTARPRFGSQWAHQCGPCCLVHSLVYPNGPEPEGLAGDLADKCLPVCGEPGAHASPGFLDYTWRRNRGGQLAVQLLTARPALIHWSPLLLSSLGADGECLLITAIVTRTPGVQRLLTASLKSPEKMLKKCFRGGGD